MTQPIKYRKKPIIIEAIQLEDSLESHAAVCAWVNDNGGKCGLPALDPWLNIETPEGVMRADIGDYVIRGVKGEFYPCKPAIFELTYDRIVERRR